MKKNPIDSDLKALISIAPKRTKVFAYGFLFAFVSTTAFLAFNPSSNSSSPWFNNLFTSPSSSSFSKSIAPYKSQISSLLSRFFPNSTGAPLFAGDPANRGDGSSKDAILGSGSEGSPPGSGVSGSFRESGGLEGKENRTGSGVTAKESGDLKAKNENENGSGSGVQGNASSQQPGYLARSQNEHKEVVGGTKATNLTTSIGNGNTSSMSASSSNGNGKKTDSSGSPASSSNGSGTPASSSNSNSKNLDSSGTLASSSKSTGKNSDSSGTPASSSNAKGQKSDSSGAPVTSDGGSDKKSDSSGTSQPSNNGNGKKSDSSAAAASSSNGNGKKSDTSATPAASSSNSNDKKSDSSATLASSSNANRKKSDSSVIPGKESGTSAAVAASSSNGNDKKLGTSGGGGGKKREKWIEDMVGCDIFQGHWAKDDSYPLYSEGSCHHIDEPFDCYLNGRPDHNYQKLRWKPDGCNIPRLNATDMLERLRGKRLVFVGDSLNRNMWESLVCVLKNSVKDKKKVFEASGKHEFRTEGSYSFLFKDYGATVEFFRSPFLVQEWEMHKGNATKETLRLDIIERSSSKYKNADVIIFNTGHWWTHEKTSKGKDYYQEGNRVYSELNVVEAFHKALNTWAKWVDTNVNSKKSLVFFRGYSASHFSGGQWNSGGACDKETEPIKNEKYLSSYLPIMSVLESVIKAMKTPVSYLNITRMTDYRKDAHPSVFRKQNLTKEERRDPERFQDCSHWCLPGVPDSWNELLYAQLIIKQYQMAQ